MDRFITIQDKDFYTWDYIEHLRKEDAKKRNPYKIIAQRGGQENMLSQSADIMIVGGSRGGSKSYSLLLETLKDYTNKNFRATILRYEIDDLSDLIDTSYGIYSDFGTYNRSKADMSWNFNSGASLKFNYYSDKYEDFKVRMQGRQYAYIGIDEITHMEYNKFKYLITNNRNAFGIRNRIMASCNPDPDSWVAKFIDWWIGEDGLPIKERDGVRRYCFMNGDEVQDIIWGNSKEEVYEQCRDIIDRLWIDAYSEYGSPADLFVKSVAFVEARLVDNIQLMRSDPTYLANLAGQSEEQRSRDLEGNWKYKSVGDDMIKMSHMEAFFNNPQQIGDGVRRASLDAAFDGGDNLVMWLWEGWHLKDLFVCRKDSKDTVNVVKAKLKEWRVLEENFTYDLNGIGQIFKGFFASAIPFNNRESVAEEDKGLYDTIKSQSAYLLAKKIINREISIEPTLLDYRFDAGKNKNVQLRQILMEERKAIRANSSSYEKGFTLIKKSDMKKLVGHSPDFIDAMLMRMIFEIKTKKSGGVPKLGTKYISPQFYHRNTIFNRNKF
ncbi:MAG TPA: terminase family protein [Defluviitoga tunisiensis]|nr:terminase family protein [Defluviitoga tunisiensis]